MKKIIFAILILLVCSIAGLVLWRYITYLNDPDPYKTFLLPRVSRSVIEISSLSAEKTEMSMKIQIKNQLPISFRADSFQYNIYINDAEVIKSRYTTPILLEGNDSSWITLPVTAFNREIDSVITANENRHIDSAEYRMHASFYTHIFFNKHFNVTVRRYLPLIHIPDLKVNHVEVDSLNFKRAAVTLHAAIKNDNVFDIKLKDYAYELQIEDHEWVKGILKGYTVLKAKATTEIEIPVSISFKEISKTIFKLLAKGKDVKYNLVLNLVLESDVDLLRNSKATIKSSGTVKSLLKTAKGLSAS